MIHLLLQAATANPSPFEWVSQHIHMLGWGTVVVAAWKIASFFAEAKQRVLKTEHQIESMATNHFPHMEASLKTIDTNIVLMTRHMTGSAVETPKD